MLIPRFRLLSNIIKNYTNNAFLLHTNLFFLCNCISPDCAVDGKKVPSIFFNQAMGQFFVSGNKFFSLSFTIPFTLIWYNYKIYDPRRLSYCRYYVKWPFFSLLYFWSWSLNAKKVDPI